MSTKFPLTPTTPGSGLSLGITLPPAPAEAAPCPPCPPPTGGTCVIGPPASIALNSSPGTVAPAIAVYVPGAVETDTIVWTASAIVTDGSIDYMNTFGTYTSAHVLVVFIQSPTTTGSLTLSATVNGVAVGSINVLIA